MNLNRWINWKHRRWIIVNSKWLECVWDSNIDPILRHVAEDRNGHGLPRVTYYSSGCAEQRCCWYDWCTGERLSKHLLTNLLLMLWCFQLPHRLYMCLYMCLYISLLHCVPHTLCQMQNMGPWGLACRSVWRSAWWSLLWSTSTAKSWIKDDRASDSDRKKPFQKKGHFTRLFWKLSYWCCRKLERSWKILRASGNLRILWNRRRLPICDTPLPRCLTRI